MNYTLHTATYNDLPSILSLQAKIVQSLADSTHFAAECSEFFSKIILESGSIQLAKIQNKVIGCAVLYFPEPESTDNLGFDLNFTPKQRQSVAHLDSAFIDVQYRCQGIASILSQRNIEYALNNNKEHILCTAHPCNVKSIKNLFALKLAIVGFSYKYGGLERFVFRYLPQHFQTNKNIDPYRLVPCQDFEDHQDSLAKSLIGTRLVQMENMNSIGYFRNF